MNSAKSGAGGATGAATFAAALASTTTATATTAVASTAPAALPTALLALGPRGSLALGARTATLKAAATATTVLATALTLGSTLAGGVTAATGLRSLGGAAAEKPLEPADETTGLGLGRRWALRLEGRSRSRSRSWGRSRTGFALAATTVGAILARTAAIATAFAGGLGRRLLTEGRFSRSRAFGAEDRTVLAASLRGRCLGAGIAVPPRFWPLRFRRGQNRQLGLFHRSGGSSRRRCDRHRSRSRLRLRSSNGRRSDWSDRSNYHRGGSRNGSRRRLGLPRGERILIFALSDNHLNRGRLVIAARSGGGGGGGSRVAALAAREA